MRTRFPRMGWLPVLVGVILLASGCSRQQGDWDKARTANSIEAYQQFVKNYPSGDFTAQAQARIKELEEERDWQKARDSDTTEGYQSFLKLYPEGKWTEEARIRIENFSLAQPPAGAAPEGAGAPATAQSHDAATVVDETPETGPKAPATHAAKPKLITAPSAAPARQAAGKAKPSAAKTSSSHSANKAAGQASGHRYSVQLGAFSSGEAAAEHAWGRLAAAHPVLLKGLSHRVVSAKSSKGGASHTLYKLQATGLSRERARSVCHALVAKKQSCLILAP